MSARWSGPLALAALLLAGCIDTSVEATTIPLEVSGEADARAPFEGRAGAVITLARADLAFGPLYLCAGASAGELCEEALAEWPDARVVDTLDPELRSVGEMNAITGTTRSYMYDLGLVSLLGQDAPLVTDAAESLGGQSAVIEGTAEVGGQVIPFSVAVRVAQEGDVEQGVSVVRSGSEEDFEAEILPDGRSRLRVRIDPRGWLATASFATLVEDASCAPGIELACAGSLEQRCADDGSVAEARDCAASGQVCLRNTGCVDELVVGEDDQIARAVRAGISAGERPRFTLE